MVTQKVQSKKKGPSLKPLNILFISHKFFPDIGGIESISEILAVHFSNAGHQVRLLTWSQDPSRQQFPFEILRNPGRGQLFREFRWADIVFENNPCLRLSWPNLFFSRPLVVALHTWISNDGKRSSVSQTLKYLWLNRARRVIAVSNAIRAGCWENATVIGNPYQEEVFRQYTQVEKDMDFVFVGRLVSDKGADLAIKAIHLLNNEQHKTGSKKKYTLTIIGDGEEKNRLEALAMQLNLQHLIHFKGFLRGRELAACLNRHRFVLVPSVWQEPFGLVALEGMACGCVPIVSDAGGLPDAVGNAGLIFPSGNAQALANCMSMILANSEMEQAFRKAAVQHLAAHQTAQVAQKYLEVIDAVS